MYQQPGIHRLVLRIRGLDCAEEVRVLRQALADRPESALWISMS